MVDVISLWKAMVEWLIDFATKLSRKSCNDGERVGHFEFIGANVGFNPSVSFSFFTITLEQINYGSK